MKNFILSILLIQTFVCFGQSEFRINEIRALYKDYNESMEEWDNYEIKLNTGGSYPSITIYTDFEDKVLVKTGDAGEFGSEYSEYYFFKNTIQFIYSKSEWLTTHWGADTVRYKKQEFRFYFEDGKVIKTLKKKYEGIENGPDTQNMGAIPNTPIDYKKDTDCNWFFHEQKLEDFILLLENLERLFQ